MAHQWTNDDEVDGKSIYKGSTYTSLHQNLKGNDGNGVLTGGELSPVELGGERKGNGIEEVGDRVHLLDRQEEDARKWSGH
jgi:hypothetical protein